MRLFDNGVATGRVVAAPLAGAALPFGYGIVFSDVRTP